MSPLDPDEGLAVAARWCDLLDMIDPLPETTVLAVSGRLVKNETVDDVITVEEEDIEIVDREELYENIEVVSNGFVQSSGREGSRKARS